MISRGLVWALGVSQLVCWGISYYLIAVFGDRIAEDTGWTRPSVFGGYSAAIAVTGLVSPRVGRIVERFGGRPVMTAGSVLLAAGCAGLALSRDLVGYYLAWACLGIAMRMTLYDAAFAALARIAGREARRPISQITLLGGLASTALWPVGQALIEAFGWRAALLCYAGFALATVPLHLAIPDARHAPATPAGAAAPPPRAVTAGEARLAGGLYAVGITCTAFLASAMSAHMIGLLTGLGLAAALAVWVAALRGVGQTAARFGELVLGRRLDPLVLGIVAAGFAPLSFGAGFWGGASVAAALAFSLLYGAGNGLATIVRGTQPLVLFDPSVYGSLVGRLVTPGFFVSATAPVVFAWVIERHGEPAALGLALAIAILGLASALALWLRFR